MTEAERNREAGARAVRVEMALTGLMQVFERHAAALPLDERDRFDVERARAVVASLQAEEAALLARTEPPPA